MPDLSGRRLRGRIQLNLISGVLHADSIEPSTADHAHMMVASGRVFWECPASDGGSRYGTNYAYAERATYNSQTGVLVLMGEPAAEFEAHVILAKSSSTRMEIGAGRRINIIGPSVTFSRRR